jgi:phosphomannomutase
MEIPFRKRGESVSPLSDAERTIFRSYDIRGSYPHELNEEVARILGHATAVFLGTKKIAVGHDSRLSSPVLREAIIEGFLARGVEVIDLGYASTPFVAWVMLEKRCDAVMITASHNDPPLNGLKISSYKIKTYISAATGMGDLQKLYEKFRRFGVPPTEKMGVRRKMPAWLAEYGKMLQGATGKLPAGVRIAVDCSHGVGGLELIPVLERMKVSLVTLNEQPDGRFPSHGPNPLKPESQRSLAALLKKGKYSFGVIFDGDGDRVLFFDERGNSISAISIASLIADFYLPKVRTNRVVTVISFSKIFVEAVRKHKGKIFFSPVGRTNVALAMIQNKAYFGAENSGHYFFKEFGYLDNGALAVLKVLKIIAAKRLSLSKLIEPFGGWTMVERSVEAREGDTIEVLHALRTKYMGGKVSKIDGLSVEFRDWWFNVRRSNTEPVWRLTVEGREKSEVGRRVKEIEEIIGRQDVPLDRI